MTKEKFPRVSPAKATELTIRLYGYYGGGEEDISPVLDEVAVSSLTSLAQRIMSGEVNTHQEIQTTIRGLGPSLGAFGGLSTEIDEAAAQVVFAVSKNEFSFTDSNYGKA